MTDYTAGINAKGCDQTGITEDLAATLYNGGRSTLLAIVELSVVADSRDRKKGTKKVNLVIDTIEPVICENAEVEGRAENDIRRVQRALYMNRKMEDGELPLDREDNEPVLADVLAATEALVETDEKGEVAGLYAGEELDSEDEMLLDPEDALDANPAAPEVAFSYA